MIRNLRTFLVATGLVLATAVTLAADPQILFTP